MKRFYKKTAELFVRPVLLRYLRKDRYYNYQGLKVLVKKGVFHPGFFYSTKFFIAFLQQEPITGKTVLELGAGSGLISLVCAKRGASVTAVDINPACVESILISAKENGISIEVYLSDLFAAIPIKTFDYIIINPPYYRKKPQRLEEQAWYAGEQLEYFQKLFTEIGPYFTATSKVLISLSDDCELDAIKAIASGYGYTFQLTTSKKIHGEENYLFRLIK